MDTKLIAAEKADLNAVAELLRNGEVVGVPTETVYGLAANALDVTAVRRIFEAKGRPQDNPLILHIGSMDMLYDIAETVYPLALELAEHFWPGPLTMIFPKKAHIPSETCGGLDTAAVRMPRNSFTLSLIKECGFPLAAPSANISGLPSPTKAQHVFRDMNGKIPVVIDGGSCDYGVESTVISFDGDKIRILRPGAVTAEMLREFADVVIDNGVLEKLGADDVALSPGMKYKHYSPKADVFILNGANEQVSEFMRDKGDDTGFLGYGDEVLSDAVKRFPYGKTAEKQAENLFSSLREADDLDCREVYVRIPEKEGLGLAVYNRLLRSAAFRVINL